MIDLTPVLQEWRGQNPRVVSSSSWNIEKAQALAESVAKQEDLKIEFDPPDEEFILLADEDATVAMLSVLFPLAFAAPSYRIFFTAHDVAVVQMSDINAAEFRVEPDVMKDTLLRNGLSDLDVDAFSAWDIFAISA